MQIYLNCPSSETDPTNLIRQILTRYHLQDEFLLRTPSGNPAGTHNTISPLSAGPLTVIATAVGADGPMAVGIGKDEAISQLVRALEALTNRNVKVKITHADTTVAVSGSAGSIENSLKSLLK